MGLAIQVRRYHFNFFSKKEQAMELFIGVDVCKAQLDIHLDGLSQTVSISNTFESIQEWIETLSKLSQNHQIKLIICEATGGYEALMVTLLKTSQFPVHVVHANKVRHFAKSIGILAKTDKIDCHLLSQYAKVFRPQPDEAENPPEVKTLQLYIKRRQQLIKQKVEEVNRLDKLLPDWLTNSIKVHVAWLEEKITESDRMIKEYIESVPTLQNTIDLLTSIPGVGILTAATVFSSIPNIGTVPQKSLTTLIGLAPFNRDSGKIFKKRSIYGGRKDIRSALYMATVASLIHNPFLKSFYDKLKAKGKPSKVAIVACMRKLLMLLNAVAKRQSPWINYTKNP
jgi:transposase